MWKFGFGVKPSPQTGIFPRCGTVLGSWQARTANGTAAGPSADGAEARRSQFSDRPAQLHSRAVILAGQRRLSAQGEDALRGYYGPPTARSALAIFNGHFTSIPGGHLTG